MTVAIAGEDERKRAVPKHRADALSEPPVEFDYTCDFWPSLVDRRDALSGYEPPRLLELCAQHRVRGEYAGTAPHADLESAIVVGARDQR